MNDFQREAATAAAADLAGLATNWGLWLLVALFAAGGIALLVARFRGVDLAADGGKTQTTEKPLADVLAELAPKLRAYDAALASLGYSLKERSDRVGDYLGGVIDRSYKEPTK